MKAKHLIPVIILLIGLTLSGLVRFTFHQDTDWQIDAVGNMSGIGDIK